MTLLQLVNKVLRRLRETTVTTLVSDYSLLVVDYINEAKEIVEGAWKWKALRTTVTFPTVVGQAEYNLGTSGVAVGGTTNERSLLLYDECGRPLVFNTTLDTQLQDYPLATVRGWQAVDQSPNALPYSFAVRRISTGLRLVIYPEPDAVYTISADFLIPQADLSGVTDVISVPAEPVWRLALAMAEEERGTGMGARADALYIRARNCVADYVGRDIEPGELDVYPE